MRVQPAGNILDLRTHRLDKLATQPGTNVQFGGASASASGGGQQRTGKARTTSHSSGSGR
jgi:hypothetical protein